MQERSRTARRATALLAALLAAGPAAGAGASGSCGTAATVAVQVLGSGGPELGSGRASSSYLVWIGGKARLLVDLGAGSMLRFGESGARLDDLDLVALSHLHVDHAGDLPALLKAGYFSERERPLPLAGPAGGGPFPGVEEWLVSLLAPRTGAYRYLSGALDGSEGQFALRPIEVPVGGNGPVTVLQADGYTVEAIGVGHGPVPALAYRVRLGDRSIVFGGDQDGESEAFWRFARNADLLVAHLAIPESAGGSARRLHAPPSVIGRGAAKAGVRRLALSHLMTRSEATLDESLESIREAYSGPLEVADDLDCFALRPIGSGS